MSLITYVNNFGDTKKLLIKESCGEGGTSTVHKAILDGFGLVAVKNIEITDETEYFIENDMMIKHEFGDADIEDPHFILVRRVILHETRRNSSLASKYPNLMGFSVDIPKNFAVCMYRCADSVDLFEMLSISDTQYPDDLLATFFTHLCVGLKILHDRGIAHRDIKPDNIMMDEGLLKYIDFGFACLKDACFKKTNLGTRQYAAPDLLNKVTPKDFETFKKRDIYALGVTFYAIITRTEWVLLNSAEEIKNKLNQKVPLKWAPFIFNMINPNESDRFNIDQCINYIEDTF